ncbi:MAG: zinc-ribbon domain-containing protein [Clostridiales bacterium]|nr:zinc-ribbon domain-containing protein [Clostridiales bacterium]
MDDLKSTFVNITKAITKTSGDLLKTTKLSMNIANEESALKNIYIDIGKKVHEIYAYGGTLGAFFDEKYQELTETELKIKELKEQLDMAKGTKTCVHCGRSAPHTAEFCPKCGKPMSADAPVTDYRAYDAPAQNALDPPPSAAPKGRTCTVCSHVNADDVKFCEECGRML